MDAPVILPELNIAELQLKANEYAMKGALDSIKEFYSGYNSPYKKKIEESLMNKEAGGLCFELPDIIAVLNDSLKKEIDEIANTAIAKTFVPLVKRILMREEPKIEFSTILKRIIELKQAKSYECSVEVEKHEYGWLEIKLDCKGKKYELVLHKQEEGIYQFMSLPYTKTLHKETMRISLDGATLEMPFITDVLKDDITSYIARLVLSRTFIEMDCNEFDEYWFNDNEE